MRIAPSHAARRRVNLCFNVLQTQTAQREPGVSDVFFVKPVQRMETHKPILVMCLAVALFDNKLFRQQQQSLLLAPKPSLFQQKLSVYA